MEKMVYTVIATTVVQNRGLPPLYNSKGNYRHNEARWSTVAI